MAYTPGSSEPIAIVGSACRFADSITTPSRLWEVASQLSDLSQRVPDSRFNADAFYHEEAEHQGTTNSRYGYFLGGDHRRFDATFFNITPREAEAMDPQHRLLLEVVYEALESAGFTMQQCAGKSVGVFAGTMTGDYEVMTSRDTMNASQYAALGTARSIMSNRISYIFDFRGPSMTIDTACSSSLVALHQAIQSVRSGETSMACVTGANLMLTPEQFIAEANLHMLSPTGRCCMWDEAADGYARGEGIAALFIKPLSLALADGDHIQAIIRETGVNSDGKSQGITRPSAAAQTDLIISTYTKTGLDPKNPDHQPQFFEAHGTGTPVGDPLEAQAIAEAFFHQATGTGRADSNTAVDKRKMLVGSVKTIIGHTEGAAGLAGVLKVVQCLNKGSIIPNLHFNAPNPAVLPFLENLSIVESQTTWPEPVPGHPRRASVNSFGFGGTNAHCIIEQYRPEIHDPVAQHFRSQLPKSICQSLGLLDDNNLSSMLPVALPLVISGASPESLRLNLIQYEDLLQKGNYQQAAILSWQLFGRQGTHEFRKIVDINWSDLTSTSTSMKEVQKPVNGLASSEGVPRHMIRATHLPAGSRPKILGIFTGQGAQYPEMSKGLYGLSSVYRVTIKALDKILQACSDPPSWSIEGELMKSKKDSRIGTAEISQVTCCALQIGLVDFLSSIGITFSCVIGHSSGEVAAAYAAGRISQRDAILISYYRGKFTYLADGIKGGMAACGLSKATAEQFCLQPKLWGRIGVAASNAPSLVTLSGDLDALQEAMQLLEEQDIFVRQLKVDTAYHSFYMRPVVKAYTHALHSCGIRPLFAGNGTEWISTVSGQSMEAGNSFQIEHWGDNMQQPVLFYEAVKTALASCGPFNCVIEVSPSPTLKRPVQDTFGGQHKDDLPYTGVLNRYKEDRFAVSDFLGFMWAHFGPSSVDIRRYILDSSCKEITRRRFPVHELPTYAWDHNQIHWRESRMSTQYHSRKNPPHELLGVRTTDDDSYNIRWRNILKMEEITWLGGHQFQGQALLPASAYCIMALEAASIILPARIDAPMVLDLTELEFISGIIIDTGSLGVETLFTLTLPDMLTSSKTGQEGQAITADFTLTSVPLKSFGTTGAHMTKNFQGKMRIAFLAETYLQDSVPKRAETEQAETLPVNIQAFYDMMDGIGLNYTGPFRGLKSLKRRLDYAVGTLDTHHVLDSTTLSISPALLDSCFQATFATFSSPGDKALWTSFLPTKIDRLRLYKPSRVHYERSTGKSPETIVEAYLTDIASPSQTSSATFSADMLISNSNKEKWIEIEGLKVSSLTQTTPEDDYELYLTTVLDLDPEQELVKPAPITTDLMLEVASSCERVAQFYSKEAHVVRSLDTPPTSPKLSTVWKRDLDVSDHSILFEDNLARSDMTKYIESSPIYNTLKYIRETCQTKPELLPHVLSYAAQEAYFLLGFKQYIQRVVQQIAHRYPRMNVLGLTDPRLSVTEAIMKGLGDSFRLFTSGQGFEASLAARMPKLNGDKLFESLIDIEDPGELPMPENGLYDMVVLSTSIFQKAREPAWSPVPALQNLRRIIRNGGFLIVINISMFQGDGKAAIPTTPPDWSAWLEEGDFCSCVGNADQEFLPNYSLHVRQARSSYKDTLRWPSSWTEGEMAAKNLLIVGGVKEFGLNISVQLRMRLGVHCTEIDTATSLGDITPEQAEWCTAIISLADLEVPVATNLDDNALSALKRIMRSGMLILWVTSNTAKDKERAASLGLIRSLKAETPDLAIQVFDVDPISLSATTVFEGFCRWAYHGQSFKRSSESILWSNEGELHIDHEGKFHIPRVVPNKAANARLNATRRFVTTKVDSAHTAVVLQRLAQGDGSRRDGAVTRLLCKPLLPTKCESTVTVRVEYSTTWSMELERNTAGSLYVCIGRDLNTGVPTVALSSCLASIVRVPKYYTSDLSNLKTANLDLKALLAKVSKLLFAVSLINTTWGKARHLVLVNVDQTVRKYLEEQLLMQKSFTLHTWTTSELVARTTPTVTYLHPWTSIRELKKALPESRIVRAFIPKSSELWKSLVTLCNGNDVGYGSLTAKDSSADMLEGFGTEFNLDRKVLWDKAVEQAIFQATHSTDDDELLRFVTPTWLVNKNPAETMDPFTFINWRDDRELVIPVAPHLRSQALHEDRTYLLVGLTRDLGQSLCRLFIAQGATHIVVASRSPSPDAKWIAELNAQGASIHVASVDVTDLISVQDFKAHIKNLDLPFLGGIINGAMILEDKIFANMTLESWNRVMGPKATGTTNLDAVFGHEALDFFILTSSFAAIGGHAGQSAYAAANMYMNAFAAQRHAHGKAGSVLNIGVIYGLGLLAREDRKSTYHALERDGYPPISERDLHHMFLEAIETGRPGECPRVMPDITTGLARFREDDPNPQHWQSDERFGHLVRYDKDDLRKTPDADEREHGSLKGWIRRAGTQFETVMLVRDALCRRMEEILQRPHGGVRGENRIADLGVDSLAAVEIRNWFHKALGVKVAVMKILGSDNIDALSEDVALQYMEKEF